jgi:hypothetical protein
VFDNTSDVSMGDDDVSFLILYTYCRPSASQTRFFCIDGRRRDPEWLHLPWGRWL